MFKFFEYFPKMLVLLKLPLFIFLYILKKVKADIKMNSLYDLTIQIYIFSQPSNLKWNWCLQLVGVQFILKMEQCLQWTI